MSRHTIAAAAAILALTACGGPAQPAPATSASTATSTANSKPHQVRYSIFGAATHLTYTGQAGNEITKTEAENGIGTLYTATLLDGDTARIEVYGVDPHTGIGCSISVDDALVDSESSRNAVTGVACAYTVR